MSTTAETNGSPPPAGWPERRQRAEADCALIAENPGDLLCAERIRQASFDPKWEVRKVLAECLSATPEPLATELAVRLARDSNAMVRSAAERSISRRSPASALSSSHPSAIQTELDRIERKFGIEARQEAFHFAERTAFLHVRTAVHDIKNILTHFNLDTGALLKIASDPGMQSRLQRFENGRNYLIRLVEMMEAYSRDLELTWQSVDLVELLKESISAACEQVRNEGKSPNAVECTMQTPASIIASVSRFHFAMVLTNLIKNAIQSHAISEKELRQGRVSVEAGVADEKITIVISDTGKGLSPRDLQKLMDFVPGNSSKPGGMGYGLPICRRYTEAHGGKLTIESEENKGTRILVTLPANGGLSI